MRKILKTSASVLMSVMLLLASVPLQSVAENPIVQTIYTADGAPMVWNDTFYMFTGHDEDNAEYFTMNEWRCYSSTDMANWTDLGVPLNYETFSWASGEAWASQCVERNGKFYFYVTVTAKSGGRAIGVAVADKPEGPYTDPIGKPLAGPNWSYIDPTVFIDDDGQAYMYWGNPKLWYVKLHDDMISCDGEPIQVDTESGAFGPKYTEAPYLYKHGDWYYMLYAADGVPENIAYSVAKTPEGPWTYGGIIMPHGGNSFTNHPSIIDYKGKSYFTYHTGTLEGGGGFQRSMCIEEFTYNADGTIPTIDRTSEGCSQIEWLNPYVRNEAETICWEMGIETESCSEGGMNIGFIQNGDYVKVSGVDFGEGAGSFTASVASAGNGGKIEIHLDSVSGPVVGTCNVPATGGWQTWTEVSCDVSGADGKHDVFFKFSGGESYLFNVDWWQFEIDRSTIIKGDLNSDGVINAFDLAIAKRGLIEGLTDSSADIAADVDENGEFEVVDVIQIMKFVMGRINVFTVVEKPTEPPTEPAKPTQIANPLIWADVPDMDYIRVGDTYYMISTTMYFNPGAPIMKSKDLVSWELCSYVYDTLENNDTTNLLNGRNAYGNGQWATSLRYKNGRFYVFFASNDQGKSYIFQTDDIESGKWEKYTLNGVYHDASLFFDDDGKNYLIYGSGTISIKQLNSSVTDFEPGGVSKVLMKGDWDGLCEGSRFYKIDGYYYNCIIGKWPRSEMVFRSKELLGNYEYKTVMSTGVGTYAAGCAQGGMIDTPDGQWYSLMFQDHGSVGRIPCLIPVTWQDHWPVFGVNGKVPTTLTINTNYTGTSLACSDEFSTNKLPLEWQWNHNPDNTKWSLTEREGWLRLKTGTIASDLLTARNSLTQRTEGPACTSSVKMDVSNMKQGDYAGIAAFQEVYGQVGVYVDGSGNKKIFMAENGNANGTGIGAKAGVTKIIAEVPLMSDTVYFKIDYLFATFDQNAMTSSNDIDKANFFYSYDGQNWTKIGSELSMKYKLTLFTGYRTAIFNYATKNAGGYVDVDWYHYSRRQYQPSLMK